MKKLVIFAVVLLGIASTSFAQTARADANILTSVSVATVRGFNFGDIFSSVAGGSVLLTATASEGRTGTGVTLGTGTGTSAQFTITGSGSTTAPKITWPSTGIILTGPGSSTMTLSLLNAISGSGLAITSGTTLIPLDASGNATVYMGGTLTVGAKQAAGTYSNTTALAVTVAY